MICIAIVLSVATSGGLLAGAECVASTVYNKLKAYAHGEDIELDYKDLAAAYDDFKANFTQEQIDELRNAGKGFRLYQDLVMTPMSNWQPTDESLDVQLAFTRRIVQTFERFWPVYTGNGVAGEGYMKNAEHVLRFADAVTGQGSDAPTLEMWRMALKEYRSITKKIYVTIWHEDVYQNLDELELLMNFTNDVRVRVIMGEFMDELNECESDEELLTVGEQIRERINEEQNNS